MAYLIANNGPFSGKQFELSTSLAVLGRHPECDIVVDVGAVSRHHCRISKKEGELFVEDCKSRNKTFLNDNELRPEQPYLLKNGDVLRICDVSFTFHGDSDAGVAPVRPSSLWQPLTTGRPGSQVLIEDSDQDGASTIMSKLDVSADSQRAQVIATPQVKLRALIDITHALSKTLLLDEVLPRVLDSLFSIFLQADRGFVVMRAPTGELVPMWTKVRRDDDQASMRISKTIIEQVMRTRQAILSADAASDDRFELSQSVADFRIRSMMCAPLLDAEGEPIGVLQVDTLDQNKRFQNEDLEVLATVALQAGIAIDNAQMHEQSLRQRELERELMLAQQVQNGFLPERPPTVEGYEFYDYYQPAHHVGGDYFDYLVLPDRRVAIVVADVVGHGIAAALMMAKLSAEFRYSMASEDNLSAAMNRLNRAIAKLHLDRFVTMVLVVLDPPTGELTVAIAGHYAPRLRRADGTVEAIAEEAANIPLGIEENVRYEQATARIEPGEVLIMWTDGINETMNDNDEELNVEPMEEVLAQATSADPEAIGNDIIQLAEDFRGAKPADDDICLVCFSRNP